MLRASLLVKKKALRFHHFSGASLLPWRGEARSAGPDFSPMRNRGKNRQRRGLPPPCGIHPAVLDGVCAFLFSALTLVGSHGWHGKPMGSACSSAEWCFYRQGLTLVSRCFQLTGAWFPAAETPHTGVRPWKQGHRLTEKEMRSIDLPGHLCDLTRARAVHRIDAVPASYPREVLRGERPKRVFGFFCPLKRTPQREAPPPGWQAGTWAVRRSISLDS